MKKNEFIDLTYHEICQRELELRSELVMLRLKRKIGQLEKTHRFSTIRRDVARLMCAKAQKCKDLVL
ncbi:MAG: 50S ribosomal protein L29 [Puniceicoccales bacterium]|jgi:ribosomal protein L29|nr:50S ribosomal protein L29 [Puniceicoccales bacterium]